MINHPDVDLADPDWNTSGVPWHALYYKNVFHHALSIRPA
jgi:aclacinomycin oxidase